MPASNGIHANGHGVNGVNGTTVNGHAKPPTVLIVGGGPVGLLGAYCLSKLGVTSRVIEKHPTRLGAPKAHALNPRSLEIARQFDISVPDIRAHGSPRHEARHVRFLTTLAGEELGTLPYERMDVDVLNDTPEMIHNIPQPEFEELLRQKLETDPNVELVRGVEWIRCLNVKPSSQHPNGSITSTVRDRQSGAQSTITTRYVIGCDGAKSTVRESLGVTSTGEDAFDQMMTMHFTADLRTLMGERTGMLHWCFEPTARGLIIGYDLGKTLVLLHNYDPRTDPIESFDDAKCRRVLTSAIGKDVPFELLGKMPWVLSRRVADKYRVGQVFLAGDAAHSFPPTGGLGLNSGTADIHNLACKIAAVEHGWAGDALLDTYEADRRPVALVNSAQSVKNGIKVLNLLRVLTDPNETDPDKARAVMMQRIHDPEYKSKIAIEVEEQREHFDNLGLHIGQVYGDSTVPANASDFTPRYCVGSRLPHAWIRFRPDSSVAPPVAVDLSYVPDAELPSERKAAMTHSTLDLVSPAAVTLLVNDRIDAHACLVQRLKARGVPVQVARLDVDYSVVDQAGETWVRACGLDHGAALAVRNDQHIIARIEHGEPAASSAATVSAALGL